MRASDQPDAIRQAAVETEQLFSEYSPSLVRYLRTGLRDATEIEDLAQETFIRYFQARSNGEAIENPKGWLYRVGRRLALDHAKKAKPVLLDDDAWRGVEAARAEPARADENDSSQRWSHLPWHMLSAMEKECLLLRAEGLTFREVAEVLDVSMSSVASYVARAIKKFQRAIPTTSETPDYRRTTPLR